MNSDTAYCQPPDPELRAPARLMGPLSCDTHAHVCGPESGFAYTEDRIYTPPDALSEDYVNLLNTLGIERAVLVQPSVYGTDNTVLLKAMSEVTAAGIPCRGVAVVDNNITDDELERMNSVGVRGLRFNLVDVKNPEVGVPLDDIIPLCERASGLGWHSEFLIHVDDYPDMDKVFANFPTDIVVGHVGYVRLGGTPECDGFHAMLRLAESGKCWIKLTAPYRISRGGLPYEEAETYTRAAAATVPDRCIWGSDWPHVKVDKPIPNDADMCDLFENWVTDESVRQKLLVDNPVRLYGF